MNGDLRVWWMPQVPMKSFYVDVKSVEEGIKVMDVLAKYDAFQYDNNIKPDYSNMGGLEMYVTDVEDGDEMVWEDWYYEDENVGYYDDPKQYLVDKYQAEIDRQLAGGK